MNRLQGSLCYLVGSIDDSNDLGVGWRREIIPLLKELGVISIDPTNKPSPDDYLKEDSTAHKQCDIFRENEQWESLHNYGNPIRGYDLRCTDKADFIIVCLDYDCVLTGTLEELFISNHNQKPVLIFCVQGKKKIPNWIYWAIKPKYIFNNVNEIIEYLEDVDEGLEDSDKRWKFFDWNKITEQN